jgi:hypothetical protein
MLRSYDHEDEASLGPRAAAGRSVSCRAELPSGRPRSEVRTTGCDFRECCICRFRLIYVRLNNSYVHRTQFSDGRALFPECSRKRPFKAISDPQTCVDVRWCLLSLLRGRKGGLNRKECLRNDRISLEWPILGIEK